MRPFQSTGVWRHKSVIVVVYFSYIVGLVSGALSEETGMPRGMISITRGIFPTASDTDCDFAGNIVLGGFFSLESEDKFFTVGSHQLTAFNLMVDQINRYQCGVRLWEESAQPNNTTLTERNYALELRTYDDQSSIDGSSDIARALVKDPSVDIMVGGYSSTLTQQFVEIAHNTSNKLVLAPGAGATKVFADKDLAFGLLPPSSKYLSLAVEALATIHGAKTIATVWEDASFTRGVCGSAADLAEQYGMTMTSASEVTKTPNADVLEPIAESLKHEDPDVVITCVYDCQPWIQAMRRANWSPKAQVFTVCVGQEDFSNQAGADTAYIMGVTPWDSSLQIKDAVTGWSASEFASRFRRASKEDETSDVPYQAAMAASLISMLHQTIQGVNEFHQNGPQLANYISKNSFQTMGGNLAFDENGQLKAPSLTIQYDENGVVQTVYPPEASSGPILYPMPTWDHRDCINLSGCEREKGNSTEVFFDAGNTCDNRGMCLCGDPLYSKSVGSGATANCIQLEEMNYISQCLKVFSSVLSGLLLTFCIFCLGWTYWYRENALVKVSQPLCLVFVVIGSILSILSILTTGVEGSYREDTDNIQFVDFACMATPWLWGMGFAITYSALFAKVCRVHRLYKLSVKMRRQSVDYKDVSFIIIIVLALEMIVLIFYQVMSPQIWQRDVVEDIDGYSIESIGKCNSESGSWFQMAMVILNVILLFVALILCWQTKDLPSDFSESNYIFLSVMFMFQVLLLAVPVSAMVHENANVFFFVRMGGVFLQNVSVLLLMFLPKMRRIFIGEDTTMSIKNAISSENGFRDSINRSSFIGIGRTTPSKIFAEPMDSKDKVYTHDAVDVFSKDSMDRPNLLVVEGISQSVHGGSSSIAEEISKAKDLEKIREMKDIHDEELAVNRKGDYRVSISQDVRPKTHKPVSWRYEASSHESGSVSGASTN